MTRCPSSARTCVTRPETSDVTSTFLYAFGCTTPGRCKRVAAVPFVAKAVLIPARWIMSGVRVISCRDSGFGIRDARFDVPCSGMFGIDAGDVTAGPFESRIPDPESRPDPPSREQAVVALAQASA